MSHASTPQPLTLEERIYGDYRRMVTSRPKNVGYPARFRQQARQAVVTKFGIPFSEVKRIVAEQDKIHGITH